MGGLFWLSLSHLFPLTLEGIFSLLCSAASPHSTPYLIKCTDQCCAGSDLLEALNGPICPPGVLCFVGRGHLQDVNLLKQNMSL